MIKLSIELEQSWSCTRDLCAYLRELADKVSEQADEDWFINVNIINAENREFKLNLTYL